MSRRGAPPRTIEYRAHEELGYALASVCFSSPLFYRAITAGFARAMAAKHAGRRFDKAVAVGELARATTGVHHVNQPPPASRRRPR